MAETQESKAGGTPPTDDGLEAHRRSVVAVAEATHTTRQLHSMLEFGDDHYEYRRLFSELLGTFMLVFVAAGGLKVPVKVSMVLPMLTTIGILRLATNSRR